MPPSLPPRHSITQAQKTARDKSLKQLARALEQEVKASYDSTLRQLMVAELIQDEASEALRPEGLPIGCDYSTPWHGSFVKGQQALVQSLRLTDPLYAELARLWLIQPQPIVSVHVLAQRQSAENTVYSPIGFNREVAVEASSYVAQLNNGWFNEVADLLTDHLQAAGDVLTEQYQADVLRAAETAMRVQLSEAVTATLKRCVADFELTNAVLPRFNLQLCVEDLELLLKPSPSEICAQICSALDHVVDAPSAILTLSSWLSGTSTPLGVPVDPTVRIACRDALKTILEEALVPVAETLTALSAKFAGIIGAQEERASLSSFLESETLELADFERKLASIQEVRLLVLDINNSTRTQLFDVGMTSLRRDLLLLVDDLAATLIEFVATKHHQENERICRAFEVNDRQLALIASLNSLSARRPSRDGLWLNRRTLRKCLRSSPTWTR